MLQDNSLWLPVLPLHHTWFLRLPANQDHRDPAHTLLPSFPGLPHLLFYPNKWYSPPGPARQEEWHTSHMCQIRHLRPHLYKQRANIRQGLRLKTKKYYCSRLHKKNYNGFVHLKNGSFRTTTLFFSTGSSSFRLIFQN